MGEDNVAEYTAAMQRPEALHTYLDQATVGMGELTASAFAEAFGSLLPDVDQRALTGELADDLTADLRGSVSTGVDGWLDDDLAMVNPWGFDLEKVETPVALWHGTADQMAPIAEARVLAATLPFVVPHILDGEGRLLGGSPRHTVGGRYRPSRGRTAPPSSSPSKPTGRPTALLHRFSETAMGVKMMVVNVYRLPIAASLAPIASILTVAIGASLPANRRRLATDEHHLSEPAHQQPSAEPDVADPSTAPLETHETYLADR